MYGETSTSWHVPELSTFEALPATERLYVIFLQQLAEGDRESIVQRLEDVDEEWTAKYDADPPPTRQLQAVPWIRDNWPSQCDILLIAQQMHKPCRNDQNQWMRSCIFVDSGWDADSVIAARWDRTPDDEATDGIKQRLEAMRVPMSIAERLLTLLDSERLNHFTDIFDEGHYAEAKLDLHAGVEEPDFSWPGRPIEVELPSTWPSHDAGNGKGPHVYSLRNLSEDQLSGLRSAVESENDAAQTDQVEKINVHHWPNERESPSRAELWRLFHKLRNASGADRYLPVFFVFFVDNLLNRENDEPELLVAKVRRARPGFEAREDYLEIGALKSPKTLLPLCRTADSGFDIDDGRYMNTWRQEKLINPDKPLEIDSVDGCPVFFLSPFAPSDECKIRNRLGIPRDWKEKSNDGKDYNYLGWLWPENDHSDHFIQDLRDLLETSYPASPVFNPGSKLRIASYPAHFIAVDRRILDEGDPKVYVASNLDFHRFNGDGFHSGDNLGWQYGSVAPVDAHTAWINLDIANMALMELVNGEGTEELWLIHLTWYAELYRRWKEEDSYGDMP